MPTSSEAHRIGIGLFQPTFLKILLRKSTKSCEGHGLHKQARYGTHRKDCELSSYSIDRACLSVVFYLCVILLIQSMDVETNPGPWNSRSIPEFQAENLDKYFSQFSEYVSVQNANMYSKMESLFTRLESSMTKLQENVLALTETVQRNRSDINDLQFASNNTSAKIDELEQEMERLQFSARQSNLKFIGIPESETENTSMMINMLNHYSSSKNWKPCDINYIYRAGQRNNQYNKPRPLIVCFRSCEDKISILRDSELREHLRENGVKVTADLTPRQRAQVQEYRDQGLIAFFKGGRLHVQSKQSVSDRVLRPNQRDRYQHTDHNYRSAGSHHIEDNLRQARNESTQRKPDQQCFPSSDQQMNYRFIKMAEGQIQQKDSREVIVENDLHGNITDPRTTNILASQNRDLHATTMTDMRTQQTNDRLHENQSSPLHTPPTVPLPTPQSSLITPPPACFSSAPTGLVSPSQNKETVEICKEPEEEESTGDAISSHSDDSTTVLKRHWKEIAPTETNPIQQEEHQPRAVDDRNYAEVVKSPPRVNKAACDAEGNPPSLALDQHQCDSQRTPLSARDSRPKSARNSLSHPGQVSARRQTRSKSQSQAGKQGSLPSSWRKKDGRTDGQKQ